MCRDLLGGGWVKGLDMWRQGVRQQFAALHVGGIIGSWMLVMDSVRRRHSVATVGVANRQHIRGVRDMPRGRRS